MNSDPMPVSAGVQRVLSAPRGQRFTHTRTGTRTPTREERMLAQMRDNPRVAHRLTHGALPAWMEVAAQRRRTSTAVPRPRPAPDDSPAPRKPEPAPFPRRPGCHRKPRRRVGWHLAAYTLTAGAGALTQHLLATLL